MSESNQVLAAAGVLRAAKEEIEKAKEHLKFFSLWQASRHLELAQSLVNSQVNGSFGCQDIADLSREIEDACQELRTKLEATLASYEAYTSTLN